MGIIKEVEPLDGQGGCTANVGYYYVNELSTPYTQVCGNDIGISFYPSGFYNADGWSKTDIAVCRQACTNDGDCIAWMYNDGYGCYAFRASEKGNGQWTASDWESNCRSGVATTEYRTFARVRVIGVFVCPIGYTTASPGATAAED